MLHAACTPPALLLLASYRLHLLRACTPNYNARCCRVPRLCPDQHVSYISHSTSLSSLHGSTKPGAVETMYRYYANQTRLALRNVTRPAMNLYRLSFEHFQK